MIRSSDRSDRLLLSMCIIGGNHRLARDCLPVWCICACRSHLPHISISASSRGRLSLDIHIFLLTACESRRFPIPGLPQLHVLLLSLHKRLAPAALPKLYQRILRSSDAIMITCRRITRKRGGGASLPPASYCSAAHPLLMWPAAF